MKEETVMPVQKKDKFGMGDMEIKLEKQMICWTSFQDL